MTATNPSEILKELLQLAEGELDDQLPERVQQLQEQGIELKVETSLEKPEFVTDPNTYTEVIQYCELWIGDAKVYEWQETYWGSYGGMGAGWWIEQGDTSMPKAVLLPEFHTSVEALQARSCCTDIANELFYFCASQTKFDLFLCRDHRRTCL